MSTVLLVDDDLESLWALQLALESRGHHVLLAESGGDALRKLAHVPANAVVTDLEMPEMDGAELCRRLRCQPVFAQLPIVLMSAAPEPTVGPLCWTMYLRKPVDLSSLLRALDCFVAHRLTATSGSSPEADRRPRAGSRSTPAAGRVMTEPLEITHPWQEAASTVFTLVSATFSANTNLGARYTGATAEIAQWWRLGIAP
jgi:CheY-like chemotaxis protein